MNYDIFEKIISLSKRRGFFYQSCDIYGGLNGIYDKGPFACKLEENIKSAWIKDIYDSEYQIIQIDGSILGHSMMWQASGHIDGFNDPMIDCLECKARYRTDEINTTKACHKCGNKKWGEEKQFNMMFSTNVGPVKDSASIAFLRPETAQSIFSQFKNIISTNRLKIPFGIMQIGKSFRNEITPRQFLFRLREFSQMELEFFCKEENAINLFEYWKEKRFNFFKKIGFYESNIRFNDHKKEDLSHYSKATTDIECLLPFGWKEVEGIAYRTNFDLSAHTKFSGKELSIYDDEKKCSYIPHVVECSVGLERLMFAILCNAYHEDEINGEIRIVLKLNKNIAPYKAAIFPLTNNEIVLAKKIYKDISNKIDIQYDESGSIGKRYRRQDEIGTPYCITIDQEGALNNTVTIRHRDSTVQERIAIEKILEFLEKK